MSFGRHIGVALFTLLITLLLPTEAAGLAHDAVLCYTVQEEKEETSTAQNEESRFTASDTPLLSTTTTTVTPPSVTPLARTVARTASTPARLFQHTKAVSAIDSTTAATRYGLYNHKILFCTLSRCYYLYRLRRLII